VGTYTLTATSGTLTAAAGLPKPLTSTAFGMRLLVFGAAGERLEAWRWQLRAC
jgi:hypothetical protein